MSSLAKNLKALTTALGIAAAGLATGAQAQTACGVIGIRGGTQATVVYDPFNPSGLASTNVVMNVDRINPGGGGKTEIVNFYLKASSLTGSSANGIQIIPLSVSGQGSMEGQGLNIFYNNPVSPGPTMIPAETSPTSNNRFLKLTYNGNAGSADTLAVTFQVIMPANLNLDASTTLEFDAEYQCKMSGGEYNKQTQGGTTGNALVFPVTVLSALRTYYAGTALAFNEIGQVPAIPPTAVRTDPANHVVVQSSGAYSVQLSSQNAFRMKKPGAASVNDEVRYSLKFLGDTRDSVTTPAPNAVAISHNCIRAEITGTGHQLPIQATLVEGGAGKNPSPNYSDILTVTVTPLIYGFITADNCGNYAL